MKHTPAPWQAAAYDDGAFEIRNGAWPHGFIITTRNGYPDWKRAEESKANAHLIAESPLLLSSLEDVLSLALLKWGNLDPDANKVFETARKVIARAKGEGK